MRRVVRHSVGSLGRSSGQFRQAAAGGHGSNSGTKNDAPSQLSNAYRNRRWTLSTMSIPVVILAILAVLIGTMTFLAWHVGNKSSSATVVDLSRKYQREFLLRTTDDFVSSLKGKAQLVRISASLLMDEQLFPSNMSTADFDTKVQAVAWALFRYSPIGTTAGFQTMSGRSLFYRWETMLPAYGRQNSTPFQPSDLYAGWLGELSSADDYMHERPRDVVMRLYRSGMPREGGDSSIAPLFRCNVTNANGTCNRPFEKVEDMYPVRIMDERKMGFISNAAKFPGVDQWDILIGTLSKPVIALGFGFETRSRGTVVAYIREVLTDVSRFLNNFDLKGGRAFFVSKDGYLVATQDGKIYTVDPVTDVVSHLKAVESPDVVTREGARYVEQRFGMHFLCHNTTWTPDVVVGGEKYFIDTWPINFEGLELSAVMMLPRAVILEDLDHNRQVAVVTLVVMAVSALAFSCVLLSLFVGIKFSQLHLKLRLAEECETKKQFEAEKEAKTTFLSNMSHELRTPVACIIGMLDHLQAAGLTWDQRTGMEQINYCAVRLLQILNSILDIAKEEAGKLILENERFNIWSELESLVNMFAVQCERKGLEILLDLADDVPEIVRGDQARLLQIFSNLIGNAIKFTSSGHVVVRGWVEDVEHSEADTERVPALEGSQDDVPASYHPQMLKTPPKCCLTTWLLMTCRRALDITSKQLLLNRCRTKRRESGFEPQCIFSNWIAGRVEKDTKRSTSSGTEGASMHSRSHVIDLGSGHDDAITSRKTVLIFEVEDTGPGVPEELRERIFEGFVQGDASITRKFGGTGLGLHIARSLIRRMGGSIAVREKSGRGAVFRFHVQLNLDDPHEEDPSFTTLQDFKSRLSAVKSTQTFKKTRMVLVMCDSLMQRKAFAWMTNNMVKVELIDTWNSLLERVGQYKRGRRGKGRMPDLGEKGAAWWTVPVSRGDQAEAQSMSGSNVHGVIKEAVTRDYKGEEPEADAAGYSDAERCRQGMAPTVSIRDSAQGLTICPQGNAEFNDQGSCEPVHCPLTDKALSDSNIEQQVQAVHLIIMIDINRVPNGEDLELEDLKDLLKVLGSRCVEDGMPHGQDSPAVGISSDKLSALPISHTEKNSTSEDLGGWTTTLPTKDRCQISTSEMVQQAGKDRSQAPSSSADGSGALTLEMVQRTRMDPLGTSEEYVSSEDFKTLASKAGGCPPVTNAQVCSVGVDEKFSECNTFRRGIPLHDETLERDDLRSGDHDDMLERDDLRSGDKHNQYRPCPAHLGSRYESHLCAPAPAHFGTGYRGHVCGPCGTLSETEYGLDPCGGGPSDLEPMYGYDETSPAGGPSHLLLERPGLGTGYDTSEALMEDATRTVQTDSIILSTVSKSDATSVAPLRAATEGTCKEPEILAEAECCVKSVVLIWLVPATATTNVRAKIRQFGRWASSLQHEIPVKWHIKSKPLHSREMLEILEMATDEGPSESIVMAGQQEIEEALDMDSAVAEKSIHNKTAPSSVHGRRRQSMGSIFRTGSIQDDDVSYLTNRIRILDGYEVEYAPDSMLDVALASPICTWRDRVGSSEVDRPFMDVPTDHLITGSWQANASVTRWDESADDTRSQPVSPGFEPSANDYDIRSKNSIDIREIHGPGVEPPVPPEPGSNPQARLPRPCSPLEKSTDVEAASSRSTNGCLAGEEHRTRTKYLVLPLGSQRSRMIDVDDWGMSDPVDRRKLYFVCGPCEDTHKLQIGSVAEGSSAKHAGITISVMSERGKQFPAVEGISADGNRKEHYDPISKMQSVAEMHPSALAQGDKASGHFGGMSSSEALMRRCYGQREFPMKGSLTSVWKPRASEGTLHGAQMGCIVEEKSVANRETQVSLPSSGMGEEGIDYQWKLPTSDVEDHRRLTRDVSQRWSSTPGPTSGTTFHPPSHIAETHEMQKLGDPHTSEGFLKRDANWETHRIRNSKGKERILGSPDAGLTSGPKEDPVPFRTNVPFGPPSDPAPSQSCPDPLHDPGLFQSCVVPLHDPRPNASQSHVSSGSLSDPGTSQSHPGPSHDRRQFQLHPAPLRDPGSSRSRPDVTHQARCTCPQEEDRTLGSACGTAPSGPLHGPEPPETMSQGGQTHPHPEKPLKGMEVLVAEDTGLLRKLQVAMLQRLGAKAIGVEDGKKAVEAVCERAAAGQAMKMQFDLLLMDCQMPVLDGYSATRAIREMEQKQETAEPHHLPIIALTAHAMKYDEDRCLNAGMDAYLMKPMKVEQLLKAIKRVCPHFI